LQAQFQLLSDVLIWSVSIVKYGRINVSEVSAKAS